MNKIVDGAMEWWFGPTVDNVPMFVRREFWRAEPELGVTTGNARAPAFTPGVLPTGPGELQVGPECRAHFPRRQSILVSFGFTDFTLQVTAVSEHDRVNNSRFLSVSCEKTTLHKRQHFLAFRVYDGHITTFEIMKRHLNHSILHHQLYRTPPRHVATCHRPYIRIQARWGIL